MENPNNLRTKSKMHQITGRLTDSLRWLTRPASSLPEHLIHQSVLLAWTLLLMIALALPSIIVNLPGFRQQIGYTEVELPVMVFVFIIAFIVNRIGHYTLAAMLTIIAAVIGSWGTLIVDPVVLQGELIPLIFVAIPVLLTSLLLPPLITALFAGIQLAALAYVHTLMPLTANINWVSFLTFIIIISAASILTSFLRQRDLSQIRNQKRLLVLSEAKLREQSIRDYLTGLYNRRYLDETIDREILRAERAGFPIGIIMLDIDYFKDFNDKYGHAAGDLILQEIASLLKSKIRYADIVCRYGGEEFVVVMPEASLQITLRRAEDLRQEVKALKLQYEHQKLGKLTISSGVALYPDHGSTAEAVMKSADSALFSAKDSGRDRVVIANVEEVGVA